MSSKALLQATLALRVIFSDVNQRLLKAVSKGIFYLPRNANISHYTNQSELGPDNAF